MKDNRGTELEVGQEVVYNLSGQVAKGKIVSVGDDLSRYGHRSRIKIELLHKAAGMAPGHISTVTNPLNVLALQPGTCPNCGQDPFYSER